MLYKSNENSKIVQKKGRERREEIGENKVVVPTVEK